MAWQVYSKDWKKIIGWCAFGVFFKELKKALKYERAIKENS